MSQGMCLYDAQQRIVFANDRYAEIYGLTPEQVKPGTSAARDVRSTRGAGHLRSDAEAEDFVRDGLARFGKYTSEILRLDDGRFISVVRRPMPDGGLLSTHEDITEREQLSARLARQNELLTQREQELNVAQRAARCGPGQHAAGPGHVRQQIQRLVICNRRYAEMYGLSPEQVKPGTPLREIIEHRIANGEFPGRSADELIAGDGRARRRASGGANTSASCVTAAISP